MKSGGLIELLEFEPLPVAMTRGRLVRRALQVRGRCRRKAKACSGGVGEGVEGESAADDGEGVDEEQSGFGFSRIRNQG